MIATDVCRVEDKRMDQQAYREIMRHHAGAVTIITVGKAPTRTGLTATAFCSLTDNPPMVLACVNRSASAHDLIERHKAFCVNVLAMGQQDVAMRFAGRVGQAGEERFDPGAWSALATGAPVLEGALANLDCELVEHHDGKTHSIFVGVVKEGRIRASVEPLIYFRGEFCRVSVGPAKPAKAGKTR
jgi:flavin reductase (DIM6/NTAB) family NADH-FMN oxidoreductase RutF